MPKECTKKYVYDCSKKCYVFCDDDENDYCYSRYGNCYKISKCCIKKL